MANVFDQFDRPEMGVVSDIQARTGNVFDQFDQPTSELRPEQQVTPFKRAVSRFGRPVLEALGATGGAILGAPASPLGMAAGGGLGYAMGAEMADILDQWMGVEQPKPLTMEMREAAERVPTGMAYEMGGAVAGKVLGHVGGAAVEKIRGIMPYTKKGVERKAGKILAAETSSGPLIAKNVDEARNLEETIPGLKFSRAELTDDPSVIKFERAAAREPGTFAAEQQERMARNNEAIRRFIREQKGVATREDFIAPLTALQRETEAAPELAREVLETRLPRPEIEPIIAGRRIREAARGAEKTARVRAGELFEEVPKFEIDAAQLSTKIDELSRPISKFEAVGENVPSEFARYKEILEETGGKVTPADLQGLRSELTEAIRDAKGIPSPNNRKISRLNKLLTEVDNVFEASGGPVGPAEALKTARRFFRQEVVEKFRTGVVSDILAQRRGGDKITNAQIASKFFKPGARGAEIAEQFQSAIGDNPDAIVALRDFVRQDMLDAVINPLTGDVTTPKLSRWLKLNKPALEKYDLYREFDTVEKASRAVDDAVKWQSDFAKTEASKILNADVGNEIMSALAKGSKKEAAQNLMKQVSGNKKAIQGLQNTFLDEMIAKAETTTADAFQNPIISVAKMEKILKDYDPAIKVLFKSDLNKLSAMYKVRDAIKTMQRTAKSPLGGGSDTAENILTTLGKDMGFTGSRLVNIVRGIVQPIKNLSDRQVNAVINRALIDPDFAYTLMSAVKGKYKPDIMERKLTQHLATLGLVAPEREKPLKQESAFNTFKNHKRIDAL